jgi:hypothetical protein
MFKKLGILLFLCICMVGMSSCVNAQFVTFEINNVGNSVGTLRWCYETNSNLINEVFVNPGETKNITVNTMYSSYSTELRFHSAGRSPCWDAVFTNIPNIRSGVDHFKFNVAFYKQTGYMNKIACAGWTDTVISTWNELYTGKYF